MIIKNTKLEKGFKINSMTKINNMNNPQKEGFSFQQLVLFSISLILTPLNGYAEEINVEKYRSRVKLNYYIYK